MTTRLAAALLVGALLAAPTVSQVDALRLDLPLYSSKVKKDVTTFSPLKLSKGSAAVTVRFYEGGGPPAAGAPIHTSEVALLAKGANAPFEPGPEGAQPQIDKITGHAVLTLTDLPSDLLSKDVWFTTQVETSKSLFAESPARPLGLGGITEGRDIAPNSVTVGDGGLVLPAGANANYVLTADSNGKATWKQVSASGIADSSITATQLASSSVGSSEIASSAVGASEIASSAVGASEIASNAVGSSEIATGAVGSSEVADGSLTAADLATSSVGASEIASGAVGTSEVADNSLTSSDLAANSVGSSELADSINLENLWIYNGGGELKARVSPTLIQVNQSINTSKAVELWGGDGAFPFHGGTVSVLNNAGTFVVQLLPSGDIVNTGSGFSSSPDPYDPTREIRYGAMTGPEVGTYLRGQGRLQNGYALIELPEHFAATTLEEGLTAQVTARGPCMGLYVEQIDTEHLIVRELISGNSDAPFDYLIQGVRAGFEAESVYVPNTSFLPEVSEWPAGQQSRHAAALLSNGVLRPDGSIDTALVDALRDEVKHLLPATDMDG
jgi:hypothetical protein